MSDDQNGLDWLKTGLSLPGAENPEDPANVNAENEALQAEARETEYQARLLLANWCREGFGPSALDDLKSKTVEVPLIMSGAAPMADAISVGMAPSDWAFWRDGQNSIYHFLTENVRWCERYEADQAGAVDQTEG